MFIQWTEYEGTYNHCSINPLQAFVLFINKSFSVYNLDNHVFAMPLIWFLIYFQCVLLMLCKIIPQATYQVTAKFGMISCWYGSWWYELTQHYMIFKEDNINIFRNNNILSGYNIFFGLSATMYLNLLRCKFEHTYTGGCSSFSGIILFIV